MGVTFQTRNLKHTFFIWPNASFVRDLLNMQSLVHPFGTAPAKSVESDLGCTLRCDNDITETMPTH